jgi:hypothetical protein
MDPVSFESLSRERGRERRQLAIAGLDVTADSRKHVVRLCGMAHHLRLSFGQALEDGRKGCPVGRIRAVETVLEAIRGVDALEAQTLTGRSVGGANPQPALTGFFDHGRQDAR